MEKRYDIAICGSGPIGAATAYALRERSDLRIAVVTRDPADDPDHQAAYRWAGGSIRLAWADPWKLAAVQHTVALARQFAAEGVALHIVENGYLFLNRGEAVPGLNLAGAPFVRELLRRAVDAGVHLYGETEITSVSPDGDAYRIRFDAGEIITHRVLLALGAANARFIPDYPLAVEKRQVFILDLPVEGARAAMPHLVLPLEGGVVYCFVKNVDGVFRLVVGQEGVLHDDAPEPVNYFPDLLARGLADRLPFLADAAVLRILWGFDAQAKTLTLTSHDERLFVANCGSAVRAAARLGDEIAERLLASLAARSAV